MICPKCDTSNKDYLLVCEKCGELLPYTGYRPGQAEQIRQGARARDLVVQEMLAGEREDPVVPPKDRVDLRQGRGGASQPRQGRSEPPRHEPDAAGQPAPQETAQARVYGEAPEEDLERIHRDSVKKKVYGEPRKVDVAREVRMPHRHRADRYKNKKPVNWVHVGLAGVTVVLLAVVGVMLYMANTPGGQRMMARMGREANSTALWEVGEEKYDTGDVENAIAMFRRAMEQDGEDNVNVPGVVTMATAYESLGMVDEAEALYRYLYTEVVPSAAEPYTNTIRIMLSQGRDAEAAELMRTAYQNTGSTMFYTQRRELLPQPPEVNVTAGTYDHARELMIRSPEGYDVYYTLSEDAVLPQDGVLFTNPIYMDEGFWRVRAVAVNDELISNELSAVYRIVMPSPGTPECNLAPNTYSKRIPVKLRKNPDNEKDDDIIIYYTIDGSMPNEDSPIYDGEAIQMPAGNVTLQAIAVNKYGKASNTFSRLFKFDTRPLPLKAYTTEDTCNGVELYNTTLEQFQAKYGMETSQEIVTLANYDEPGVQCHYRWGYAAFVRERGISRLVELYLTDSTLKGPRGTETGMTETAVIGKFRDMGQVASPSGNRGLYTINNSSGNIIGTGKFYLSLNGQRLVRYETVTADSHGWRLDYLLTDGGVVKAIDMVYLP